MKKASGRYAALAWPLPVREGQAVAAGEQSAPSATRPLGARTPHLHFEAYQDSTAKPAPYLVE